MQPKKIAGTSIIEITVALVIISICMGIASQFFVGIDQRLKNTRQLLDETRFQNWMLLNYELDTLQNIDELELNTARVEEEKKGTASMQKHQFNLLVVTHTALRYSFFKTNYSNEN